MTTPPSGLRVGVYVDGENVSRRGGRAMRFGPLCEFARRGGAETIRLNAYVAYDQDRARRDPAYRDGKRGYHNALREHGFKVIEKAVRWFVGDDGERVGKANADLDLAVDLLTQCERLDRILLASGDGDFARVVNAAQGRGCRVEVVAFDSVSADLRHECDQFVSGYLVPGLLPGKGGPLWQSLLVAGAPHGLLPIGLGARDTLRLEARMPLYGQELGEDISPYEAGIGWAVKLKKGDFVGRDAMAAVKQFGAVRKTVGFRLTERSGAPRPHYPVQFDGREIGYVTSGAFSPTLGCNIGLALVEADAAGVGRPLDIVIRGKPVAAEQVAVPFYKRENR